MTLSDKELKYFSDFGTVVGIDEAGRGPLAGPLVVSSISLDLDTAKKLVDLGVNDSKKVTEKRREEIFAFLNKSQINFAIQEMTVSEVDQVGVYKATQVGIVRAYKQISPEQFTLVDGYFPNTFPFKKYKTQKGGDGIFVSVAAASILSKVYRDRLMQKLHKKFPNYGFAQHKGYGTKAHFEALKRYGPCEIHRRSFAPIKRLL